MATTGREVASGTLWMTKGEKLKIRARVVARCGTTDCTYQGQIVIYEESTSLGGVAGVSDKPTRIIQLSTVAQVTSLNGSHPTTPVSGEPLVFGLSLDGRAPLSQSALWGLMLVMTSGEAVELFADTKEQQQQWIQYLNLLSMFPYSPIPEEPRNNPIRSSLRSKLKPSNYNADSVWLVYVLAEEVGSRIQALGVHIITLRSSLNKDSPALMSVVSPLDSEPIVTWEPNKMRRTGSLGNMVFIEVGRRCEGGPGLIWMYACPEDLVNFRETLKRFLFMGDGRPANGIAVSSAAPTQEKGYMYDKVWNDSSSTARMSVSSVGSSSPSSSGGSSFRLSFNGPAPTRVKTSAEYDIADEEEDIVEYDYAINTGSSKASNRSSVMLPLSSTPPPINLVSHPSRKKDMNHKRSRSIPGKTNDFKVIADDSNATDNNMLTGQLNGRNDSMDSGLASTMSLEEDFQLIDKSLSSIMSELNETCAENKPAVMDKEENRLNDLIAELEDFATSGEDTTTKPVKRSNTLPSGQKKVQFKRANSTSTCQPMHYMKLRNPKSDLMNEGYIMMRSGGSSLLDKVPEERNNSVAVGKDHRNTKRINYDQLELQNEKSPSSEYVNHPLPPDVAKETPVLYQREYQNVSHDHNEQKSCCIDTPVAVNGYSSSSHEEEPGINEAIYMNHDQAPTTDKEMEQLFSSCWNEIDNLQQVLAGYNGETEV